MLRALAELRRSAWSNGSPLICQLEIVGTGSQSSALAALASRLGVTSYVTFHGRVSDEQLDRIYDASHLFLMPARQGYGLPALEALSRGLPVVAHKESGVSEILANTPWVELIDGEVESLLRAIRRLALRLVHGVLTHTPLPDFPSEDDWATKICRKCGWAE